MSLTGSVAVVTGGSKGIGRAIARRLAEDGVDLLLAARTADDLEATASEIGSDTGRRVETCAVDLTTPEGCVRLHDALMDTFGRLDILVNNAGDTKGGDFLELTEDDWQAGFALKFWGAVRMSRLCWPQLTESRGTVVNISGGLARTPGADTMIGGAVNAAVANFTKSLAARGLRDDVNVNVVHPGLTMTDRFHQLMASRAAAAGSSPEEFAERLVERQGIRRLGEPEDVAELVAFLCSPRARHIQGVGIAVDGGGTAGVY